MFDEKYLLGNHSHGVFVKTVMLDNKNNQPKLDGKGNLKYGDPKYPYGNLKGCIEHIIRRELEFTEQPLKGQQELLDSIKLLMEYTRQICESCDIQNKKIGEE